MVLILRGSILQRIRTTLATLVHGNLFTLKITVTTLPFTLICLPLAIFPGFRNNPAYDRSFGRRASSGANCCCACVRSRASAKDGSTSTSRWTLHGVAA